MPYVTEPQGFFYIYHLYYYVIIFQLCPVSDIFSAGLRFVYPLYKPCSYSLPGSMLP